MFDVIIVGGGPAGYTAALYSARARLETLIIEKLVSGGQMATTSLMENYPGFEEPVGGPDLALRMENQARRFGALVLHDEVIEMDLISNIKLIKTKNKVFETKSVILCMGAYPKMLGIPKEQDFRGSGVSYCAVCDGAFFKGRPVAVVGGGDTAAEDALYLARFCPKIYVIHRRDSLRATRLLQEELLHNSRIEILWNTAVEEIVGEYGVEGLKVKNLISGEISTLTVDGLFVAIGLSPNTALVKDKTSLTDAGYIKTDDKMQTNIPGVYAAGDIRDKILRQVITAAADGAVAAHMAEIYVSQVK